MIRRETLRIPAILSVLMAAVLLAVVPLPAFACGEGPGCSAETTPVMLPLIWGVGGGCIVLVVLALVIGLARRRAE